MEDWVSKEWGGDRDREARGCQRCYGVHSIQRASSASFWLGLAYPKVPFYLSCRVPVCIQPSMASSASPHLILSPVPLFQSGTRFTPAIACRSGLIWSGKVPGHLNWTQGGSILMAACDATIPQVASSSLMTLFWPRSTTRCPATTAIWTTS